MVNFFTLICVPGSGWNPGLRRVGRYPCTPPRASCPTSVGTDFRLEAGWDNWSRFCFALERDRTGDEFLRRLAGTSVILPWSALAFRLKDSPPIWLAPFNGSLQKDPRQFVRSTGTGPADAANLGERTAEPARCQEQR